MIVATGLGALMSSLSQTMVIPVLPDISEDLNASSTATQWMLTATLLSASVAVPILSRLADLFGRRLMLLISLFALLTGSTIAALAANVGVMLAGRALCGLAAASVPLGISLLAALIPPARRASAVAVVSAMLAIGGAIGLPLAGLVADNLSYRALFWISVAGSAASLFLIRILVPEVRPDRRGRVDLTGAILLAAALISIILPLAQATEWGWTSPRTWGLLILGIVILTLLVGVELRDSEPVLDVRRAASIPIGMTNAAAVLIGFTLFVSFVGTATYVQAPTATGYGFGSSMLTAGLCLLPSGLVMVLVTPAMGVMISAWGGSRVLALSGLVTGLGLILRMTLTADLCQIIVGSTVVGLGSGMGYAVLPHLINEHTPPGDLAAANGLNTLARSFGTTLASALGGSLLAAHTLDLGGQQLPSLAAYRFLFALCIGAALLTAVAGYILQRRTPPPVQGPKRADGVPARHFAP